MQAAAVNAKDEEEEEGVTAEELQRMSGLAFTAAAPKGKGKAAAGGAGRGKGAGGAAGRGGGKGRGAGRGKK